jgi:hypothetical protein
MSPLVSRLPQTRCFGGGIYLLHHEIVQGKDKGSRGVNIRRSRTREMNFVAAWRDCQDPADRDAPLMDWNILGKEGTSQG